MTKNMHFKILKIHFKNEISGKKYGKIFETGAGTGYPAGSGFSRISARFVPKCVVKTIRKTLSECSLSLDTRHWKWKF